ncbi:class I SAM-dependent methyltransferase [Roseibium marinum]|uniref:S-adenosylmethionine-diacylgycerolhomoserine-N-methyltransferase n=1 Tax=Roseibium marinum TaxID=281252 RepID=A0A2S3V4F1_9HYPH|nr:class I SAM-dependent methyltransferase [Roseibium marinum]POF34795.1 S-adenosylmethionine-diacylgycerolhomoserine-N-methyltransferase [Roseibium marinum]
MSEAAETARLMDGVYRRQRHFYDLTRKYYLLGRDLLIDELQPPAGGTVLELGCGTGRNLIAAARRYPQARFYGLDISRQMLDTAQTNIDKAGLTDRIVLVEGDAANPAATDPLGVPAFDRVFYSYTLSMIPIWREALAAGTNRLKDTGRIHVVDFGQQARLPGWFRTLLFAWLKSFHVTPRAELEAELQSLAGKTGTELKVRNLYRGYAQYAELRKAVTGPCS